MTAPSNLILDEFATLAVQQYLYDSMASIGDRIEDLARCIPIFTNLGASHLTVTQLATHDVLLL